MKKRSFLMVSIFGLILAGLLAGMQRTTADEGLVRTAWPSPEDPGMPFYARFELLPPYIYNDGEWAAIIFYRDPSCVPSDFNLISLFDIPAAFFCSHTVHGDSVWHGAVNNGAPKIVNISGNGAVPVWFVPWEAVEDQAHAGGNLTVTDLMEIEGRLVGYAEQYVEELQPHPAPAIGGGGHPNPKMIVNAHGQLEDGRSFKLHISRVHDIVRSMEIHFE